MWIPDAATLLKAVTMAAFKDFIDTTEEILRRTKPTSQLIGEADAIGKQAEKMQEDIYSFLEHVKEEFPEMYQQKPGAWASSPVTPTGRSPNNPEPQALRPHRKDLRSIPQALQNVDYGPLELRIMHGVLKNQTREQVQAAEFSRGMPRLELDMNGLRAGHYPGYLIGVTVINGVPFHIEAVEVTDDEHGFQVPVHEESKCFFDDFGILSDGVRQETVEHSGREYIVVIHPFAR